MTKSSKIKSVVVSCSLSGGRFRGGRHFRHGAHAYDLTGEQIEAVRLDPSLALADVAAEAKAAAEQLTHEVEAMSAGDLYNVLEDMMDAYNAKMEPGAAQVIVLSSYLESLKAVTKTTSSAAKTPAKADTAQSATKPVKAPEEAKEKPEAAGKGRAADFDQNAGSVAAFPDGFPYADVFTADGKTFADAKALADAGNLATVKGIGAAKAAEVAAFIEGK